MSHCLMRYRLLPLLIVCMFSSCLLAQQTFKVADIISFTQKSVDKVTVKSGRNVKPLLQFDATHGQDKHLLQISFEISDDAPQKGRWFGLYLNEPLDAEQCAKADGIVLGVKAAPSGSWWLQLAIRGTDGKFYRHVLIPKQLDAALRDRMIAFNQFKTKDGKVLTADKVGTLELTGSTYPNRLLLIRDLYLYQTAKRSIDAGVQFHTNSPINNIFEPGKSVSLQFDCLGDVPAQVTGLHCEVRDYYDELIFEHTFKDMKTKNISVDFASKQTGYYDVQAWWVDAMGNKIEDRSCIRTTGSMPDGYGSFVIMPKTIQQSEQRMNRVGNAAFLGLHGGHSNLSELLGVSWYLKATRLKWVESQKPADRSSGYAAWVKPMIEKTEPFKPWVNNFVNLGINLNRPKWAISDTPNVAPGIKSWDIYMNFFRDYIQVNKHQAQHMDRRIYDLAWEINLNEPGSGIHKPVYHPKDVVEIYRRARPILDQEDPGAILAGPCCSSPIKHYRWNLPLFQEGLLEFIDAYNCHGYHAPPPEEANIPQTFTMLRNEMKKYNHGKALDIYITELGYRSSYGSEDRQKDQARWHARVAGILKGEGIRAYYPFYSYDYKNKTDGSWGICYNLDPKVKFGPEKVSPKAAVPALAVFADQTEGLVPVSRLEPLSSDQWGYVYASPDGSDVLAMVWSVYRDHRFILPVGTVKQVTVTDMMGRSHTVPAVDGLVTLDVTPSPLYVRGLSPRLYPVDQRIEQNLLAELYPGDSKTLELDDELKNAEVSSAFGDVQITNSHGKMVVNVSSDCPAGLVGMMLKTDDNKSVTKWLAILQPLELAQSKLEVRDGKLVEHVTLNNHAQQALDARVELKLDKKLQSQTNLTLPGNSSKQLELPLSLSGDASPTRTWHAQLTINSPMLEPLEQSQTFNLLSAHEVGTSSQNRFNNTATWSGKGASGKTDEATATFIWQSDGLIVDIMIKDDVFDQRKTDGVIWQQDSIQFAFDTHPDLKEVYEPLAGIFTKKLCRIAFALTPKGPLAWRHDTHNQEQLPTGNVTNAFDMKMTRLKKSQLTHYHMVIPWRQIGLNQVQQGQSVGISILVNDSDGPQTKRAMYELFSGLTTRLPQNNGRLTLQ